VRGIYPGDSIVDRSQHRDGEDHCGEPKTLSEYKEQAWPSMTDGVQRLHLQGTSRPGCTRGIALPSGSLRVSSVVQFSYLRMDEGGNCELIA